MERQPAATRRGRRARAVGGRAISAAGGVTGGRGRDHGFEHLAHCEGHEGRRATAAGAQGRHCAAWMTIDFMPEGYASRRALSVGCGLELV